MPNWSEVLNEIGNVDAKLRSQSAPDQVRRKYLKDLFEKTGRNTIAYYSGWLSKPNIGRYTYYRRRQERLHDGRSRA